MDRKIIIFSGKQYSGKDTAAKILMDNMAGFRRMAMGDIIKLEYARQHGITYDDIENNKSNYRQGLIDLGNWGRNQSADYWIKKIIDQSGNIVITDVRIKHEYDFFKSFGAISIRVEANREIREARGGKLVGENDITEIDLDNVKDWDFVISNNSDIDKLKIAVLEIIKQIQNL